MSILNQAAVEALCSGTYLENYLDCVENMPDDLQRNISNLRELDGQVGEYISELQQFKKTYLEEADNSHRKKTLIQIQRALIKCQEVGDEKLELVSSIIEFIENRTRQLEQDLENLDPGYSKEPDREPAVKEPVPIIKPKIEEKRDKPIIKRQRRQRQHHDSISREEEKKEETEKPKKKKKRKVKKEREDGSRSPIEIPIDPDEPRYCLCDQVSYGEMIGCDNDNCVIEWFHFNCVSLTTKPKGKWFCPNCRGDRPNVLRPDLK